MGAGIISKFFSGGVSQVIETVSGVVDEFTLSGEEKQEFEKEMSVARWGHEEKMEELKLKEKELGLEDTKIHLDDRDSARKHQADIQTSEHATWLAKNIQSFISLGIISFVSWAYGYILTGKNTLDNQLAYLILGYLASWAQTIINYYYSGTTPIHGMASTIVKDPNKVGMMSNMKKFVKLKK